MDLMALMRMLWRRKLVVIPALLLGAFALYETYKYGPPVYRVAPIMVLIAPPAPPVNAPTTAGNPYVRFGDLGVVVNILAKEMSSQTEATTMASFGATGKITVAPDAADPLLDITVEAPTAQEAERSATIAMAQTQGLLQALQQAQGVQPQYFILPVTVVTPTHPTTVFTSTLRRMVAVAVVVGIFVLALAAIAEGIARRRHGPRAPGYLHLDAQAWAGNGATYTREPAATGYGGAPATSSAPVAPYQVPVPVPVSGPVPGPQPGHMGPMGPMPAPGPRPSLKPEPAADTASGSTALTSPLTGARKDPHGPGKRDEGSNGAKTRRWNF